MKNKPKIKVLGQLTKSKEYNGVMKYLAGYFDDYDYALAFINTYMKLELRLDNTLDPIKACKIIQKNFTRFAKFTKKYAKEVSST